MRTDLLAVALAASLVLVGGAAAVTSTAPMDATGQETLREAHVATSYDDGTLTVVVTNDGEPVENALVTIEEDDREREFVTDENGTVVAEDVRATDELEVDAEVPTFEAEHEYHVDGDALTLLEEKYEYPEPAEPEEEDDIDDADEDEADDDADEDEAGDGDEADEGDDEGDEANDDEDDGDEADDDVDDDGEDDDADEDEEDADGDDDDEAEDGDENDDVTETETDD